MLPPGPSSPRLVQTALFGREPLEFLSTCRERFGDAFTLRLAHEPPWVVLASPADASAALAAPPDVARAGEANAYLEPLLGPGSVIVADGDDHLARRRASAALLGHADVAGIAARHVATWRDGERVRVLPRMQSLTLDAILAATFPDPDSLAALGRSLTRLLRFVTRPSSQLGVVLLGYGAAARNPVLLARRRAVLRRIRREVESDEQAEHLLTLLVAGHDTTASALAWAVDLLARDRAALERLREGDDAYAEAVVRETLRLWPVVPLAVRRLAAPLSVGGRELPAGVAVAPCMLLVHRRGDLFGEPERFRPDRWLDRRAAEGWLPFGGGTRRCLGASFATATMKAVLVELARAADLEPASPSPPAIGRRGHTLVPARCEVRVLRRSGRPAARPRAARAG